jgi:ribonuclease-3 family protein
MSGNHPAGAPLYAGSHSALSLAYLGDAVFELCVRDMLTRQKGLTLNGYNKLAKRYVPATRQALMYHKIFPLLTEEEQSVIRRGRNLHTATRARNASAADYRHATGLETLFGHLYVTEQYDRLKYIFTLCVTESAGEEDGQQE